MKLLVVEPSASGHRMALYTRFIVREARRRGWQVSLLTTRSSTRHPAFEVVKAEVDGELPLVLADELPALSSRGVRAILKWKREVFRAIADACKRSDIARSADMIYCVSLDYFAELVALYGSPFGRKRFSGMLMSPKFHLSHFGLGPKTRADRILRLLFQRLLRMQRLEAVTVIDEAFAEYVRNCIPAASEKLSLVPDVGYLEGTETRDRARRHLGIPADSFVLLLYGTVSRRKGLQQVIDVLASESGLDSILLVAGHVTKDAEATLRCAAAERLAKRGRLVMSPGFHDTEREYRAFVASDAVWLGYVDGFYGSSGVLYQAGAAGLPVITTRTGLMGWINDRYELGMAVSPTETRDVAAAIARLEGDDALRQHLGCNGKRLSRRHTPEAFGMAVCDAIS